MNDGIGSVLIQCSVGRESHRSRQSALGEIVIMHIPLSALTALVNALIGPRELAVMDLYIIGDPIEDGLDSVRSILRFPKRDSVDFQVLDWAGRDVGARGVIVSSGR